MSEVYVKNNGTEGLENITTTDAGKVKSNGNMKLFANAARRLEKNLKKTYSALKNPAVDNVSQFDLDATFFVQIWYVQQVP